MAIVRCGQSRVAQTRRRCRRIAGPALFAGSLAVAATGCSSTTAKSGPGTPPPASSPAAADRGHLLYGQFGPSSVAMFTANVDGTGATPLLVGSDSEPRKWSPDGQHISVTASADGRIVGAVVNPDGTGMRVLRSPPGSPNLACGIWSPDATRLACEGFTDKVPARNGAYTARSSDGGDLRRVTRHRDVPCAYSPDGTQLLLVRISSSNEEHSRLMVVNVDGSGERAVTLRPVGLSCDWSADGKTILSEAAGSMLLIASDGTTTTIPVTGKASRGAFSPDGSSVVFSLDVGDGQEDIYTARRDGSHLTQITHTPQDEEFGAWGP